MAAMTVKSGDAVKALNRQRRRGKRITIDYHHSFYQQFITVILTRSAKETEAEDCQSLAHETRSVTVSGYFRGRDEKAFPASFYHGFSHVSFGVRSGILLPCVLHGL
ncbi:hypothetical protein MHYP_G00036040 [Metynnis hypsauchen]